MAYLEKYLEILPSTLPDAGLGLFTKIPIAKGTRILEYKGKVTPWEKADHQDGLNSYIYFVSDEHVIDASKNKKSLGRYANDARGFKRIKGLVNNSEYVEEGTKVYVDAVKNIPAGAEIFVPYGKEYWTVLKKNLADLK